jgi:HEPN domain-containing protein
MPTPEQIAAVVREWVLKAESDLKTASHTLKLGKECPTDTVCFHAQQCVEKYLKALLVMGNQDFPKTHDIRLLASMLPPARLPQIAPNERRALTNYAAAARYPGWPMIPLKEAREAVRIARRVRSEARRMLPRAALRLSKPEGKR